VRDAGFAGRFHAIDGNEVCELLTLHSEIRRSFPQLLGLADLDRIINRALYARSEAYLQQWQPRLAVFVQSAAYGKALSTLARHKFIVLDGSPEVGKTMIAAAIALFYATDGYEVIDLRDPEDLLRAHAPERRQIFIADDAIGSINLTLRLADAWSRDLPGILRKLDPRHLLVWTARHYILEEALANSRLGDDVGKFPGSHEVLVEVGELSLQQKAEMLYNHAKLADLPASSKKLIRERFREIISHPNFTPERIRQLCENVLRVDEPQAWSDIATFLSNPSDRWRAAYRAVTPSERVLLTALLDFEEGAELGALQEAYTRRSRELVSPVPFKQVVARLRHSFLQMSRSFAGLDTVDFRHPSLRDMLLEELRDDRGARRRYIELTSAKGLSALVRGLGAAGE